MLRVKGRASSAVAVSEENLFSTLPASQKERSRKWQCVMFVYQIVSVTCALMQGRLSENRTEEALTVCVNLTTEMLKNISSD